MTDYTKLVEALRERARRENEWYEHGGDIIKAAADAIEALEKQIDSIENEKTNLEADIINLEIALDKANTQLPKRGEWVEDTTTYAGPGLSNYKCSLCGKICGTWRMGLKQSELPNWCGNCGADMRAKMEVQE